MSILATACALLLALAPPTEPRSRPVVLSRRQLLPALGAAAAAASAAAPRPASAAFGPAGAAVTSVPDVLRINVEEWLALPADKALQRIGTLSVERLQVVSEELETALADASSGTLGDLIKRLEDDVADYNSTSTYAELQRARERAERAKAAVVLSRQLREQEKLLQQLDAQPPWVVYGAAALASLGSTLVMHPIDTLKTRQIAGAAGADGDAARSAAAPARAAAAAVAAEPEPLSIGELYVGLLPNIVKEAPSSALYLGLRSSAASRTREGGRPPHARRHGASRHLRASQGAAAAGRARGDAPARLPARRRRGRVRRLADPRARRGDQGAPPVGPCLVDGRRAGAGARPPAGRSRLGHSSATPLLSLLLSLSLLPLGQVLLSGEGRSRTLTAWSSSLLRDVPMGAVQIAVFELLKAYLVASPSFGSFNGLPAEAAFGAIGGLIGAVITTPADVVTTRIMTRGGEGGGGGGASKGGRARAVAHSADEEGPLGVAKAILAEDGPAGFFVGVGSRGLYWAPAIGIFLSLYCSLRQAALSL